MSPAKEPVPSAARLQPHRMLRLVLFFACVPTVLSFFGRWHWVADLGSHFAVQSGVSAILLLAGFAYRRDRRGAAVAGLLLLVSLVRVVPLYIAPAAVDVEGPALRAVSVNVLTSNRDASRLLGYVEREDPDVLLAMEVNGRWAGELALLRERYPYAVERPRPDKFGIAFYSKHPAAMEILELGASEVPTVVARVSVGDREVRVIGLHTLPPVNVEYFALRNAQLRKAAELAARETNPVLLLGDLNTTSWFDDLVRDAGLSDSRRGFGVHASWPEQSPLVRIAIDHALVSRGVQVIDRRVGENIGSDHRPIAIDVRLP